MHPLIAYHSICTILGLVGLWDLPLNQSSFSITTPLPVAAISNVPLDRHRHSQRLSRPGAAGVRQWGAVIRRCI